ncbi:hypothetical protein [Gluconacetobacter takamatsuzukensis]|uniref:Uncharacterized protein n=1 Tax=Gluconacetobacter takamatsuzukensis TaxID=1286190 RepID=A0A7W4KEM9_9PROT|nr:hypothetical protein [Gluconacetobacter takamatsuzukensis]MBB2205542.1 hypothetical protein [Gluconacetobacter takamatsuzukensis]
MTERRLVALHLLARADDQRDKIQKVGPGEYESGNWSITPSSADRAIGAEIHLHEKQADPSWLGGRILGWCPSEVRPGCVVFRFKIDRSLQRRHRNGWGNEQAWEWMTWSEPFP